MAIITPDADTATTITRTANQGVLIQNGSDKTFRVTVDIGDDLNYAANVPEGTVVYLDGIAATTSMLVRVSTLHATGIERVGEVRVTAATD